MIESAPGKLIQPAPAMAPDDTARASAIRRAREAFGRGLLLEEAQGYSGAIMSHRNAARLDPTLLGPCYRIGLLFASRQQWRPAVQAFNEELHRNPNDREATMERAIAYAELGDTVRSMRQLEELTRRAPGDARVWRALGFAYGRAGRQNDAERALRGSVALDGKNARAWRDLGVVLAARDKHGEAREAYRKALAVDPGEETALINLGNLEARAGEHAKALAHYHDAEARDSTQVLAYRGQIRELVTLGREPEAGVVWRRWLAVAPGNDEVREGAARHFLRQGRTDTAREIARDGVRLAPRSGEAWWLLGEMHAAALEHRAALDAYREGGRRFKTELDRTRVTASVAALRATAPDSLRALFAADSVAAAAPDRSRAKVH